MRETYTWSCAEIQQDLAFFQKSIFLVQLNQFESSSRAVPLLFGELVPLVETAFAMLFLNCHGGKAEVCA